MTTWSSHSARVNCWPRLPPISNWPGCGGRARRVYRPLKLRWRGCRFCGMEIVKRSDDVKGFVVLPRRWVVERTFSWFGPGQDAGEAAPIYGIKTPAGYRDWEFIAVKQLLR